MTPLELDDLLHNELCAGLTLEEFDAFWAEDVGDPVEETCTRSFELKIPKRGKCTIYVLKGGLVALCDGKGKWSGYETAERVQEREYLFNWAEFARGFWTLAPPTEEGTWPTRTLDGWRGKDRVFKLVEGKLTDCTPGGGFTPKAKLTCWQGYFWSKRFPRLKDAI